MFWHANHVYLTNMDRQVAMGNDSTVKFCVADTGFLKWNPGKYCMHVYCSLPLPKAHSQASKTHSYGRFDQM